MKSKGVRNYSFAIGRQIKRVFIESELYLDGKYSEDIPFENLSLRRIDEPLFLLLDDGTLLRLYATSLSVADEYIREYVLGDDFSPNEKAQMEFERLCALTVTDVEEFYEDEYDREDGDDLSAYANDFESSDGLTHLAITFDSGLRLICSTFLDFFDIEIVERD